mmetsp:Transcript_34261/g.33862  ORF Transcript_34261/g.33862 Transcript_34261/m.33862 type:complete len:107 (-) Transcript_34261:302-622(-)
MSLSKFCYEHEYVKFKRNQVVFHEGDKSNYVYIVKKGEFELTKKIKYKQNDNKILKDLFKSHCNTKYQTSKFVPRKQSGPHTIKNTLNKMMINIQSNNDKFSGLGK